MRPHVPIAMALLAWVGACDSGERAATHLRLVDVSPGPSDGLRLHGPEAPPENEVLDLLFLNTDIRLVFDRPIDPLSVSGGSIRVAGADGEPVVGRWTVRDEELTFRPAQVLSPSLGDGGFLPGERVTVTLRGFPSPAALRSKDGHWLGQSVSMAFQVVDVGPDAPTYPFESDHPPSPTWDRFLYVPGARSRFGPSLRPSEPLVLACAVPIDPSTLSAAEIVAEQQVVGSDATDAIVPVELQLTRNWDESDPVDPTEPRALLRVQFSRPLAPGSWELVPSDPQRRPSVASFGRQPLWDPRPSVLQFRVEEPLRRNAVRLDFLDDDEALPLVVEGSDGTARWDSDGRVTVRYPAAAGTGEDGEVDLRGPLAEADVHATELRLAGDDACRLPADGLVVLRSQGRMSLSGRLVRTPSREPAPMFTYGRPGPHERLSDWLARAAAAGENWTVLVAGGDLVIDGDIDVETPLLIVAGGWVRGTRVPKATDGQLWMLGEGGFGNQGASAKPLRAVGLVMDPPLENPLQRALRMTVVSSPLPKNAVPGHWGVPAVRSAHRAGSARVEYIQSELPPGAVIERSSLRPSPAAVGLEPVRVVIELVVPSAFDENGSPLPRRPWDPPFIDDVELDWIPR